MLTTAMRMRSVGALRSRAAPLSSLAAAAVRRPSSRFPTVPRTSARWMSDSTKSENVVDAEVVDEQPSKNEEILEEIETVTGPSEEATFQAETSQLLDIVAKSLYTDKEVFLRELISNAADAIEKLRYFATANGREIGDMKIEIAGNEDKKQLIIRDTGIGMTRDELRENLGTIARSGSLAFVKQLQEKGQGADSSAIIGRFGVGFYSAFMVGNTVKVYSRSVKDDKGHCWSSDGTGRFTIAEAEGVQAGTKIVIQLKSDCEMFASKNYIKTVVEKYSNFVSYPVLVNGETIKKVDAIWMKDSKEVSDAEHDAFYKYISSAYDTPMMRLMYRADAPVEMKCVFYVPQMHTEKYGMGRMDVGVNLYSRRVLIKPRCKELVPDWLRFVKGVVDSEDIPLNISRENMQDSALMRKLNTVVTKRILKWLYDESARDPQQYNLFFKEFGAFLKEGCVTALAHKEALGKLLRFESSALPEGEVTSFEEYTSRAGEDSKTIYYLCAPNRAYALNSPYYEAFKAKNVEVLFLYHTIDDFVMANMYEFSGKRLLSIESSEAEAKKSGEEDKTPEDAQALKKEEAQTLADWLQTTLNEHVTSVKPSTRLVSSPAVILDHESAAMRRMMKLVEGGQQVSLPKQKMEINPSHEIMVLLNSIRYENPDLAVTIAKQVFDNALVAAGLLDDPRSMLPRLNSLMADLLRRTQAQKA